MDYKYYSRNIQEFLDATCVPISSIMNSELPMISIVIPSFNQGIFIENTLKSIIGQSYKNYEIIVMDGGSSDQTVEILKKYDKYIKYWVSEPDQGQADAIKKGFNLASGNVFSWLNSDDIYLPETLQIIADTFKNNLADIVYGNKLIIDQDNKVIAHRILTKFLPPPILQNYKYGGFGIYQPAAFWSREIYFKSGGVDSSFKFCMDNDLFISFVVSSARFFYVNQFLAGFRIHGSSKTSVLRNVAAEELIQIEKRYNIDSKSIRCRLRRSTNRLYRVLMLLLAGHFGYIIYKKYFDQFKWVP